MFKTIDTVMLKEFVRKNLNECGNNVARADAFIRIDDIINSCSYTHPRKPSIVNVEELSVALEENWKKLEAMNNHRGDVFRQVFKETINAINGGFFTVEIDFKLQ